MKNSLALGIVLLIAGLIAGYLIFAQIPGGYISVLNLLGFKTDFGHKLFNAVVGIESVRINILLCGTGGFVAGFFLGSLGKKK